MRNEQLATEPFGEIARTAERDELLDLALIWGALRRNWLLILIVSAVTLVAVGFLYMATRPTYVATSSLMVERIADDVLSATNEAQPVIPADSPTVDTAVQVLQSPALLGRVVDRLNLTRDPEFNPDLADPRPARPATPAGARDRAIRLLAAALEIKREGVSYAISINYGSHSPRTAARIANAVLAAYLDQQRQAKTDVTERAARLLGARLQELRGQVVAAETAVADYRAQHHLFAASDVSSITQQQLSVLDTQLAEARAGQAAADARLGAARGHSSDSLSEALSSGVIGGLRQQRAQLAATVADLAARYGPRHPERVRAQQQLAAVDLQIGAELARIRASIATEANVAHQRTASINGSIEALQSRLATDNTASVRLNELQRNADSVRAIYQAFLDNYRQALARQGTESSGARSISEAQVPVLPAHPSPWVFLLAGLVAAGILSGLAVLIAEARRRA